jgi:uncharacterized protein GlcG (DUF336 family)
MYRTNRLGWAGLTAGALALALSIHGMSSAQQNPEAEQRKQQEAKQQHQAALAGSGISGGQAGTLGAKDISLQQAHAIVEAAARKSNEIGTKMNIAVVDAGGNLKAFVRQDGAWLGSIDVAIKKARTSRLFDMPTGEIGKLSQPGGPLYNIEVSNRGLITFPGGLPIKDTDGTVIGAIGVSGSVVENDHKVATGGIQAVGGKQ